jgi:branched-chain amino acid transport system permease protein
VDLIIFEPRILITLLLEGLVRGSEYALMALGLSLIFGILEIVNFAQGEFFMLGTYVMYAFTVVIGLPFPVGIAGAAAFLFAFGMMVERGLVATLRRRAHREWLIDSFVLTIGLGVLLLNLTHLILGSRRRGVVDLIVGSITIGGVVLPNERLAIVGVAVTSVIALWGFVKFTNWGLAIRATAQGPEAAQALGINIGRVYTVAFGLGAGLAAIAGAMLLSIYPAYPGVGAEPVLKGFAVVILGGLGSMPGAIVGGVLLGIIEAFTMFSLTAGWHNVLAAILVVLVLIFRPAGLFAPQGSRP